MNKKFTKSRLKEIILEELMYEDLTSLHQQGEDTGAPTMSEEAPNEFDQILSDPDIPMGDKSWLRMLGRVSGERMAVKVFRAKQAEESGGEEEIMAETSPTFGLRTGDMVRHKDEPDRGVGRVVAKGSARDNFVLVLWADRTQQRHDPSALTKEK